MAVILLLLIAMLSVSGCGSDDEENPDSGEDTEIEIDTSEIYAESYGVFIGVDENSFRINEFEGYDLVVIDAQELREEQLRQLHAAGHKVYSYLNVGSLEKSRDYYKKLKHLCLDRYDNWPDEYWVNVTDDLWIDVAGRILPMMILEKDPDIDGLFLDNLDIYAHLQEKKKYADLAENAFDSLTTILESYADKGLPAIVNGADEFVTELIKKGEQDLISGVNQETVFTKIVNYDHDKFGEAGKKENKFYKSYLKQCRQAGLEVFLLEYTKDEELAEEIRKYCSDNGYRYYISEHVNLSPSGKR